MTMEKTDAKAARAIPSNIEAEQALLGIVLYDNGAFDRCDELEPRHFAEPFHGRLYGLIADTIQRGRLAEPILIDSGVSGDPAYAQFGGLRYLADLVDHAPPSANAADYAHAIRKAYLRRELVRIGETIVSEADGGADNPLAPEEQVERAEQALFALAENKTRSGGFKAFATCIDGFMATAEKAMQTDGNVTGVSTGLIDIDAKTGGLHPSDLIILAGRPGAGKTALATNIAFEVARTAGPVGFYSLEMSGDQLAGRILADRAGVSGDKIRKGQIDTNDMLRLREAAAETRNLPIHIDDGGGTSIAKITTRARRLKRQHGLSLIVVDYLQLSKGTGDGKNRVQEISEITAGLKAMAKDLDVPVIALSQLSRQVEQRDDKRPRLSDLRESGSIEQDADMVWFVYREAYYLQQSQPEPGTQAHFEWQEAMDKVHGLAEVIIAKQRHGPVGTVRLSFNADTTRFGNLARDYGGWGG